MVNVIICRHVTYNTILVNDRLHVWQWLHKSIMELKTLRVFCCCDLWIATHFLVGCRPAPAVALQGILGYHPAAMAGKVVCGPNHLGLWKYCTLRKQPCSAQQKDISIYIGAQSRRSHNEIAYRHILQNVFLSLAKRVWHVPAKCDSFFPLAFCRMKLLLLQRR